MIPWWQFRARSRCPHSHLSGIFGDAINHYNARLWCVDCGKLLDGPVSLAASRREHEPQGADT